MTPDFAINSPQAGWTCITLAAASEIERLGEVLRAAWDSQKAIRSKSDESVGTESAEPSKVDDLVNHLESDMDAGNLRYVSKHQSEESNG